MIAKISSFFRKFHQWFSRSYWAVRLLRLSKIREPGAGQGLVLVQIDGFSKTQLERALEQRRMPFLASLLTKQHYQKHSLYSGMPSTTPAVQGELFYGVKGCVPAFNFVEHQSGKIFVMYEPKAAAEIERCLAQKQQEGGALLEGGSSYSNIFCGGASESHFCAAGFGWQGVFKALNPFSWIVLSVFHLDILMRIISLLTVEFFLAVYDCFHGTWKYGEKFRMELQFVLARVFVCVWLREMIVLGAKIDIARGLPVIHLNFFGYDEQSHRRGPSS
ncbi:MAG: hypothetical protein HY586_06615, partial [Candidatus Omnitrophica bacterium]|nr:hypothetical protein [Candidatus Omnitrophota bacterium]